MNRASDHDEVDTWLQRLVCGELSPSDPAVQARFEREPGLRERFEDLSRIAKALDDEGDETLTEARADVSAHDRERVAAFMRPRLTERVRSRRRPMGWLVAALVLITLGAGGYFALRGQERELVYMHGGSGRLVSPIGRDQDFTRFTWEDRSGPGVWYEVIVSSAGRELARSQRLEGTTWEPKQDVREAWPDQIHWEVVRGSGTTSNGSVGDADAWRRR